MIKTMMKTVYRVKYLESERGCGQTTFTEDYGTEQAAKDAIRRCNECNEADWQRTKTVPDYYIQPYSEHIEVVQVPVDQRTDRDPAKVEDGGSTPPGNSIPAWTDYPFEALGDEPYTIAPIRPCFVLSYDGDKYVRVLVSGHREEIKRGYVYTEPGRCGAVPRVSEERLERLGR